eukprot:scaffold18124_cov65-Phaeocystis_antarctica.AAC.5
MAQVTTPTKIAPDAALASRTSLRATARERRAPNQGHDLYVAGLIAACGTASYGGGCKIKRSPRSTAARSMGVSVDAPTRQGGRSRTTRCGSSGPLGT